MEGYDIPLIEAASFGSKLVCSDIDVHIEIVSTFNASFFELGNVDQLVSIILSIHQGNYLFSSCYGSSSSEVNMKPSVELYTDFLNALAC